MCHCLQKLVLKTEQQFLYLLLSPVCITSQGPLPFLVMGDVWVPYINLEIHVQRLLSADKQQALAGSTAMAGCEQPSWGTKRLISLKCFLVMLRDCNRSC